MAMSEITETKRAEDHRSRWIGIYVGILATLLAICTLGGGNATKDATRANIDATNLWNFFQAKNTRRELYIVSTADLELFLKAQPSLSADSRAAIEERIKANKARIALLSSDKEKNEGLDELWAKGQEIGKEREVAFRRDPYFDMAQALLQIAIVLASVALIAEANMLLYFSFALASMGSLLMLNGFTLLAKLPLLG